MEKVSKQIGTDQISVVNVLNFLPYPFIVSEFSNGAQRNIFVNKKFIDEIGYTCEEMPTITDWYLHAYPDAKYRSEIIADWNRKIDLARTEGKDWVIRRAQVQTRNHGLKWYEIKASISGPVHFVAFVNIHEEVIREQNLRLLNENKDRVLSILSHDLRSPLSNLHSVLQLINSGHLTEIEKQQTLEKISGRIFNMLEFLDTTLQWSKINFNDFQIKNQFIEVENISSTILAIYQPAYAEKQIKVISNINSALPLRCDPEIFSILFRNILSNAIKYTPDSGVITIDNAIRNDQYILSMENSGTGISDDKIQKIFSKNYASEPGTHGEKGLGLGLKLCLQLLENISGRLEIERKSSHGTIVRVVL